MCEATANTVTAPTHVLTSVVIDSLFVITRTNLPKEVMLFPDFPFPSHLPSFPYHYDVYNYLKSYSQHFKLDRFIKFGTLVERVVPIPVSSCNGHSPTVDRDTRGTSHMTCFDDVKWRVTTRQLASGETTTDVYDNIFVCNG